MFLRVLVVRWPSDHQHLYMKSLYDIVFMIKNEVVLIVFRGLITMVRVSDTMHGVLPVRVA